MSDPNLSDIEFKIKWQDYPLNRFLVRMTKDLRCYDQLAFKFIKQAKSVFNKTSEDYDKWIPDTYVPINLCGTPSTESNDTFFPWDWTIIDRDTNQSEFQF